MKLTYATYYTHKKNLWFPLTWKTGILLSWKTPTRLLEFCVGPGIFAS